MSITLEDLEFEEIDLREDGMILDQFSKLSTDSKYRSIDLEVVSLGSHSDLQKDDVKTEHKESLKQSVTASSLDPVNKTTPRLTHRVEKQNDEPVKSNKWEIFQRIGKVLGVVNRSRKEKKSSEKCFDTDGDDLSFDGHLFEYSTHLPVASRVEVPRLRLKPTLKERVVNLARRVLVCGLNKRRYEYSVD